MVNEKLKEKLAEKNSNLNALRKERIIKKVKGKYPHLDDEVAILRKVVVTLANIVHEQHPDIDLSELEEYNIFVESCKNEVSTTLYDER